MKVLLIGANGQLGNDLLRVFQSAGDDWMPGEQVLRIVARRPSRIGRRGEHFALTTGR